MVESGRQVKVRKEPSVVTVKLNRCPGKCQTCRKEVKQEQHTRKMEIRRLESCRDGTWSGFAEDLELEDLDIGMEEEEDADPEDQPEEGDWIFMVQILPSPEFIRATAMTSQ